MALRAGTTVYNDGKIKARESRLGRDQVDTEASTYTGTVAKVTMFPDGSGLFTITRGGAVFKARWDAESMAGGLDIQQNMVTADQVAMGSLALPR